MNIKNTFALAKETLKEKSPEILVGVGLVSIVAGVVFACKATLKVNEQKDEIKQEFNETIEDAKETFEKIDEATENGENEAGSEYTPEDAGKDKAGMCMISAKNFAKTGFEVAKEYAPAVGFMVLGITCVLFSHKILRDRNAKLLAAYAAIDAAFKAYRARVIKEGGQALDDKFMYGTKTVVEEKEITNKKGEKETVIETHEEIDYPLGSPYAFVYDADTTNQYTDADTYNDFNRSIIQETQRWANEKLRTDGFVFLSDVVKNMSMKVKGTKFEIPANFYITGWYDEPGTEFTHRIELGIDKSLLDPRFDFVEPGKFRRKIILDPNVDGEIVSKIHNHQRKKGLIVGMSQEKYDELAAIKREKEENCDAENYAIEEKYAQRYRDMVACDTDARL